MWPAWLASTTTTGNADQDQNADRPQYALPPSTCALRLLTRSAVIELDIEPTDKIGRIKEKVEEKEGIPPVQQRLIFSGKQMYASFPDAPNRRELTFHKA